MTQIGQYTLLAEIGRKALGTVYRAVDTVSGNTIALKVLNLEMLDDVRPEDMNARLQRDLSVVSQLTHPGIAGLFDVRREGNLALIVMELVDGPTITSFAAAQGGFDVSQSVAAVAQMLDALAFAHEHSVIHRDLKPSNVLVSHGTHIKITDFGLSELAARNRTQTGLLVGTMEYMAPEQFLGHTLDERCDIHAAGIILYQLLTGESPFADPHGFAMTNVLEVMPPPPSQAKSGVPAAFDSVVARALAKSPGRRFASARAFRDALREAHSAAMHQAPPETLARGAPPARIPLTDETIALGGRVLAQFVGPIAVVLSRRAVEGALDERGYFERLAAHLPDAKERIRFLHAVGY
jgi:eukaryotic-like serine/threonine-protein kinase